MYQIKVNEDQLLQIWIIRDKSSPINKNLYQSGPLKTHIPILRNQVQSGFCRTNQVQSSPIEVHIVYINKHKRLEDISSIQHQLAPIGTIQQYLSQFCAIWHHSTKFCYIHHHKSTPLFTILQDSGPFGTMWHKSTPFSTSLHHFALFRTIHQNLATFGTIPLNLGSFGSLISFQHILASFGTGGSYSALFSIIWHHLLSFYTIQ